MVWLALCLAFLVAVAVWVWGKTFLRRTGSHADLPNGRIPPKISTLEERDDPQTARTLSDASQKKESSKEDVSWEVGIPINSEAKLQIIQPAEAASAEPLVRSRQIWADDTIEIEPGLGIVCAKANHYKDELFTRAQSHLKKEVNLFIISKDERDSVLRKECGLLLASRLSDLEGNSKMLDAYCMGVPVLLAEDIGGCNIGDSVKAYFSPSGLARYQQLRSMFEANWELVPYQLKSNDRYFITHSDSGYKLLSRLEVYLKEAIGPKQEIKSQAVPKSRQLDFVVVPTLRTTSARFISVLTREMPVLAIRSYDLEGRRAGDEVPAWRWKGGDFFIYPPLNRSRISESKAY